ncbi:MAG: 1-phosphofructokinase [Lachnospiraceae bacterium]|nr:1-phosphofructokinase [Lachnospiraceae bacterium]
MIITVTMNPAIDKTVDVDTLIPDGLNRIKRVELDAGGKGINVSKTICELGGKSIATGFLGGNTGKIIENVLNQKNIENDFIWVEGETRTNTKVFSENGGVTELNEPGPVISEEHMNKLLEKLESYAGKDTLVVLAGSIPAGVPKDIYAQIIKKVHAKGASVLLDADGEMFRKALEAGPDIIKPNRDELEEYAGIDYRASEEELLEIAEKLHEKGITTVAVSMGKSGAMLLKDTYKVKCPALSVKTHSTVGAGDAMVAALSYAWDQKMDDDETVKLMIATSAGAVTTIGTKPPTIEVVQELRNQVVIERIGE